MSITGFLVLAITSWVAASVHGAVGYGYSSISVPVALLVTVARVLNPALVIVEAAINLYSLFWNRHSIRRVYRRCIPLSIGLMPGACVGALLLGRIAPNDVRLFAFCAMLPLILLQATGRRWPIRNEKLASIPLGGAIGVLYGLTTISGPPLSMFWKNQNLPKDDFKVAIAIVRTVESVCALIAYLVLGLVTKESTTLLPWIVPGVLLGFPIGHALAKRITIETFRRICMTFDTYLISFGLARTLVLYGVAAIFAYQVMLVSAAIDAVLLVSYFRKPSPAHEPAISTPALEIAS
jgi:uncharacterized membrane protein YfcA